MRIVWTEPAVEDLRELHAYITRDSEMCANGFVERIILAADRLATYRKVGELYLRRTMKTFGSYFIQRYRIIIAARQIVLKFCQSSMGPGILMSLRLPHGRLVSLAAKVD